MLYKTPRITVLMSVFNGGRWLAEAIESVLKQSLGDFEFLIIDDGSTDNSLDVIQGYAKVDTRVAIVSKTNSGLADSLNLGVRLAKGEWIARMDADDHSEGERLREQFRYVCSNPSIGLVGSAYYSIDEHGRRGKLWCYPLRHSKLVSRLINPSRGIFPHSSAFFCRRIISEIGGYRPRFRRAQDTDLWLRASERTRLACLPDPLVRIRIHPQQVSHEASGIRQVSDAMLAIVSYRLRRLGTVDPVDGHVEEQCFERFRSFVNERLSRSGYYAQRAFWRRIKEELRDSRTLPDKCIRLALGLASDNLEVLGHLRLRTFAAQLAQTVALDWLVEQRIEATGFPPES